ncbi:MAG: energy transducer TonB [Robiginitomaculum sp.]|nr:energy transducer TonB [Robiginitomaculum sp.]
MFKPTKPMLAANAPHVQFRKLRIQSLQEGVTWVELTKYERATLYNEIGRLYVLERNAEQALKAFERAVAENGLSKKRTNALIENTKLLRITAKNHDGGWAKYTPPIPIAFPTLSPPGKLWSFEQSGFCHVMFDITPNGKIKNPTILFSTHQILEQTCLKNIKTWRYPKLIKEDNPWLRYGVRTKITYRLADENGKPYPLP